MAVCVDVNLDMKPMAFDFVFPFGIKKNGRVSFNFWRSSSNIGVLNCSKESEVTQFRDAGGAFIPNVCKRQQGSSLFDKTHVLENVRIITNDDPSSVCYIDALASSEKSRPEEKLCQGNEREQFKDYVPTSSRSQFSSAPGSLLPKEMHVKPSPEAAVANSSSYVPQDMLYTCAHCGHIATCWSVAEAHAQTHIQSASPLLTQQSSIQYTEVEINQNTTSDSAMKETCQRASGMPYITNVFSLEDAVKPPGHTRRLPSINVSFQPTAPSTLCNSSTQIAKLIPNVSPVQLGKVQMPTSKDTTTVTGKSTTSFSNSRPQTYRSLLKPHITNVFSLEDVAKPLGHTRRLPSINVSLQPTAPSPLCNSSTQIAEVIPNVGPVQLEKIQMPTSKDTTTVTGKSMASFSNPRPQTYKSLLKPQTPNKEPPDVAPTLIIFQRSVLKTTKAFDMPSNKMSNCVNSSKLAQENNVAGVARSAMPRCLDTLNLPGQAKAPGLSLLMKRIFDRPLLSKKSNKCYTCTECHQTFNHKFGLTRHIKTHAELCKFQCPHCEQRFPFNSGLQTHLKTHSRQHKCLYCDLSYMTEAELSVHLKLSHGNSLVCNICNRAFVRESNLNSHMLCRHGLATVKHRCKLCFQICNGAEELAEHERHCKADTLGHCSVCSFSSNVYEEVCNHTASCHPDVPTIKCKKCDMVFLHSFKHTAHQKTHKPVKPRLNKRYKCPVCGEVMRSQVGLQTHLTSHGLVYLFECPQCNCHFTSKTSLTAHRSKFHSLGSFKCDQCPFVCKSKPLLYRHTKLIHKQTLEFECEHCKMRFSKEQKRQLHTAVMHMGDGACLKNGVNPFPLLKLYKCEQCPYTTFSNYRSKAHAITHTGVMPFYCSQCDKSFVMKVHLKRHILVQHDGSERKRCPHCGRRFVSERRYETHLQLHEMKSGLVCKQCGYLCESRAFLEQHQRRHAAKNDPITCHVCRETFKTSSAMTVHVALVHPEASPSPSQAVLRTLRYPHACDHCPLHFKTSSELLAHKLCRHNTSVAARRAGKPGARYECHFCSKFFRHHNVLRNHLRMHTGERPFACTHCNKTFSMHQSLKDHTVTMHTKEFKLKCLLCGKGCVNNTRLKVHLQKAHKATSLALRPGGKLAKHGGNQQDE